MQPYKPKEVVNLNIIIDKTDFNNSRINAAGCGYMSMQDALKSIVKGIAEKDENLLQYLKSHNNNF